MNQQAPIVVIGTGLAGYHLVKELRKLSPEQAIVMITADDGRSYSKPMLSTGFSKNKDRKSTRLNSSHVRISYAVFCLKKKKKKRTTPIPDNSTQLVSKHHSPLNKSISFLHPTYKSSTSYVSCRQ